MKGSHQQASLLSALSKQSLIPLESIDDITDDLLGLDIDLGNFQNMTFTGTNNFYLGLQSTAINYPKLGTGAQGTAQSGFWLNLQDGVTSPGLGLDSIFPISVSNEHPINRFPGYF